VSAESHIGRRDKRFRQGDRPGLSVVDMKTDPGGLVTYQHSFAATTTGRRRAGSRPSHSSS
jgi:hypothetical protein